MNSCALALLLPMAPPIEPVLPQITPPISLADAALADAHMNRHEAINGLFAEELPDDQ